MNAEFTAIVEAAEEGGYWAICPQVPGANGQGETIEEAKQSLKSAVQLILEDRLADVRRGLSKDAIEETISIPWNADSLRRSSDEQLARKILRSLGAE